MALAQALGGTVVDKRLSYSQSYSIPNLLLGATLATLRPACREALVAPWPDVVIGAGRRSVPVARWIKKRSGGAARLVQIGRPRAPLHWFDLVVTTPQYGLPAGPNVVRLDLPVTVPAAAPADLEQWRERFAALPRPWTGVLVGGSRAPYRLDTEACRALAASAEAFATARGGSLLVSTSPRTGADGAAALQAKLGPEHFVHEWRPGAPNPHHAILALADGFIVTCESVSMIAEACGTGRPVWLFRVPSTRTLPTWSSRTRLAGFLARSGLLTPPRDVAAVHERLLAQGRVTWLGAAGEPAAVQVPDDLERVAMKIRALPCAARGGAAAGRRPA